MPTKNTKKEKPSTNTISDADYKIISQIAEKYSMSVEDFGKFISQKESKRTHVRFSADELATIDKKRSTFKITRSKYCRLCFQKAIDTEIYKNINVMGILNDGNARDIRVAVSFDKSSDYKTYRQLASKFSVPFASLIRYFALTVDLDK